MSLQVLVLGGITGLTYAILAVGVVLIYRSNRFVNFAHGNLGALAAAALAKLVVDLSVPYWLALAAVLLGAGALGGVVELGIVRRLFDAPRLVLVVATIALSQLFFFVSASEALRADRSKLVADGYPVPFELSWQLAGVRLSGAHVAVLVFVPLLAGGLTAFLRFSPWGQAIRAAAENPDAARLAGISVKRMSTIVWVLAGLLAGATAVLLAPLGAVFAVGLMGPSILVRALGAALIARMTSLPVAFGAAMGIGVLEAAVFSRSTAGGSTDLAVFLIVLVALVYRGAQLSRSVREGRSEVGFGAELRPLAAELAASVRVQRLSRLGRTGALAAALVLPLVPVLGLDSSRTAFLLSLTFGYAIVGVSLTVLTGWAGQVSLGHFALVGVGAFTVARFESLPLPLVVLTAGLAAALAAVVVGLPALRIQGLFLAVSTLAFGVVATGWLFVQPWMATDASGIFLDRPAVVGSERRIYYLSLGLLLAALWLASNLRRGAAGRMLLAVRDNDAAARASGVSAVWTRLAAFALSGMLAGTAGVVFAYARQNFTSVDFPPEASLTVLLMVAVGGLGSLTGAVLGALFMFGVPALFGSGDTVTLLTGSVGVLIVLLYLPGGLASVFGSARTALADRVSRAERGLPPPPRTLPPLSEMWRVGVSRQPEAGAIAARPPRVADEVAVAADG